MSAVDARVSYEGTEQGAQQLDRLLDRLGDLITAEERAAVAGDRFERAIREESTAAQRLQTELAQASGTTRALGDSAQGAAIKVDVVEGKIEAFGSALSTLGGAMQGINAEFDLAGQALQSFGDGMGVATAMPGPLGLALGGLTTGFGLVSAAVEYFSQETTEMAQEVRGQVIPTLDDLIGTLREAAREANRNSLIEMGLGDATTMRAGVQAAEQDVERLSTTLQLLRTGLSDLRAEAFQGRAPSTEAVARYERDIDRIRGELFEANQLRERRRHMEIVSNAEAEADMLRQLAEGAANDNGRRRAAPQRDTLGDEILTDIDEIATRRELAAEAEAAHEQRMLDYLEERRSLKEEIDTKDREAAQHRMDEIERLAALEREKLEGQAEAEERLREQRLEQAREITGRIEGTLQQVASAYIDAFGQAIEGQKTLEAAALDATKALLKSIGEEMVALGIKETLEGFANIVANPPVAATKIPMGIALIAAGAGLGAAGAAIPSQPAAPAERPRGDTDRGSGEGGQMLVMNFNSQFVSAGTESQLSRNLVRQIDRGRGFGTRRAAA